MYISLYFRLWHKTSTTVLDSETQEKELAKYKTEGEEKEEPPKEEPEAEEKEVTQQKFINALRLSLLEEFSLIGNF